MYIDANPAEGWVLRVNITMTGRESSTKDGAQEAGRMQPHKPLQRGIIARLFPVGTAFHWTTSAKPKGELER